MVRLVVGTKGTGKTKKMIEMANHRAEESKGNIVFINKDHRLMYDLNHNIRVITMDDYEGINTEEGETPLYRRQLADVFVKGQASKAWVYWYNGKIEGMIHIPIGDVLRYLQGKNKP